MKPAIAFVVVSMLAAPALAASDGGSTQAEAERLEDMGPLPAERPERHVVLMPVVGMWNHTFEQSGWTAKPSPVWGMDVKVEPFSWLGVRASVLRGNQRLEIGRGALAKDVDAYQPTLQVTQLGLRLEPTLQLTRLLSGYLGFGTAWGRFVAPEAVTSPRLHTLDRTAVHVAYEGALGFAFEPRKDWVVLDLSIVGALLTSESGTAYEGVQAFSDAGHRTTMGGLSKFSAAYRAMFGVGIIL